VEPNLSIQRENPEPCQVKLTVQVPAETVHHSFAGVLGGFKKHAKIPGFRPGKTPETVVRRHFGSRLQEEARRELLEQMTDAALKQLSIHPETSPRLVEPEKLDYRENAAFTFAVSFDVEPEIALPDYTRFNVDCAETTVSEADVEATIRNWVQRRAAYQVVERPAQAGDMLKVSWKANLAEPLPADTPLPEQSNYLLENADGWLLLKAPEIIPGATAGMEGAATGEERHLAVTFPADYFVKALAGRQATYSIKVKEVQEPETVQLTDELATQYGHKDAADMKSAVAAHLKREAEHQGRDAMRKQVLAQLLQAPEFPLPPQVLARQEINTFVRLFNEELRNGRKQEDVQAQQDALMEKAKGLAREEMRRHYLLAAVAKTAGINVSYDELTNAVDMMARMQRLSAKAMYQQLESSGRLGALYEHLRENKVVDHLLATCTLNGQPRAAAPSPA
jgi:trigger factor